MDEREIIYEQVGNYTKYKIIEMLIDKHRDEWVQTNSFTGMPLTPTIYYKNNYFVAGRDFQNVQQLINILETPENSLYSESRKAFERVKTLNYNINMAFGKLDQLLRQIENKIK